MVHKHVAKDDPEAGSAVAPAYTQRLDLEPIPKFTMPEHDSRPDAVYRLIHDELLLDGSSRLNLATFVTTWMEPEADRLMAEAFDKNMIDKDEYPQTAEIERRCVNMVAHLFNAPEDGDAVGASTIGSSEAVMLGGLAMKWNWRARREAAGKSTDQPNLILGSNVQVVWEKFCRYWDVEPRYIPVPAGRYVITPEEAVERIDENTIGVVAILGTTYTGEFEPIEAIHDAVVASNATTGFDVPVHIDAASGGFVAPFLHPDVKWDFRLPMVKSINVSGHKYGLTYPGVGFVVWRASEDLPDDLVFHVNYLGGDMPTFTLNFSRPGNQIVGQYYNFLRLGMAGYTQDHGDPPRPRRAHLDAHRRAGAVRAGQRWHRDPGVRVHVEGGSAVHGVRPVGAAAYRRLAGARLHDARRRQRRRRHEGRRAGRIQLRPRG